MTRNVNDPEHTIMFMCKSSTANLRLRIYLLFKFLGLRLRARMVDLSEQLKESNFYELTVKILRYLKKINYRYKISTILRTVANS